jgi:hypothetical protein
MTAETRSVAQLVAERPAVDNQALFEELWGIFADLRAKLDARFRLQPDPSTAHLQPYRGIDGQVRGSLATFCGDEIDWLVHAWMGTPGSSFTNMHLTAWLGPQTRTPHLWMALGTIPDLFVYFDYGPRCDLAMDMAYLGRYYQPVNDSWLAIERDPRFLTFVSQSVPTREFVSPTGFCLAADPTPATVDRIGRLGHELVDRWLGWLADPEPTPPAERDALAERDLRLRRTIAERDPANEVAVKLFGAEKADQLVSALWGRDRKLPRAGGLS